MLNSWEAAGKFVDLEGSYEVENPEFGYERIIGINDASVAAEGAVAMHLQSESYTRVWMLDQPAYALRFQLLSGSAYLAVRRAPRAHASGVAYSDWEMILLSEDNQTGGGVCLVEGDRYCLLTDDEEAIVLCQPTEPYKITFEKPIAIHLLHEYFRRLNIYIEGERRAAGDEATLADDRQHMFDDVVYI